MSKSFAPEVIADSSGKWCGNGLRFATRAEAESNVANLAMRWFAVRETRVVESDDPVNYQWTETGLVAVAPPLPEGVTLVSLDNPAAVHEAIKAAVGE